MGLIRDQLITILIAARDTVSRPLLVGICRSLNKTQTASLIAFTIYMFTQHPEVAVKARAEVLEHMGPNGTPDIQEIKKLKYCKILSLRFRLPPISRCTKYKRCSTKPYAYSRLCMRTYGNPSQRGYCSPLPILPIHGGQCTCHLPRRLSTFPS